VLNYKLKTDLLKLTFKYMLLRDDTAREFSSS